MTSTLCPKSALLVAVAAFLVTLPLGVVATIPIYFKEPLPRGTAGCEDVVFNYQNDGPFTGIPMEPSSYSIPSNNALPSSQPSCRTGFRNRGLCDGKNDTSLNLVCGRPVSLGFNRSSYLYIGDANLGLFVVGPNGGLATLLISTVDGLPIGFLSGLDVDSNNELVYFTSFSQTFRLDNITKSGGSLDRTGRLIRYDPATGIATTLLSNLAGPSGVAVCQDSSCLIYTEALSNTVSKLYLTGPNAGTVRVLLTNIIEADNIIKSPYNGANFFLSDNVRPNVHYALRIDVDGNILANRSIGGPYNSVLDVTGVTESGIAFYFGSLTANFVGKVISYAL